MIGVLVPTLPGLRPNFLEQCSKYIDRQTVKVKCEIINDILPALEPSDITLRYRLGLERLKDCDIVFFMEDDDFYRADYVETLYKAWIDHGRPDVIGYKTSIYYHLLNRKWWVSEHPGRASAMASGVRPSAMLDFQWGADNDPWFDIQLWKQIKGVALPFPDQIPCVGIKHGFGKHGGVGHNQTFHRYDHADDRSYTWLRGVVGKDIDFYEQRIREGKA